MLVSPASSALTLTDQGPLCTGQTATLTCNITGGTTLNWDYIVDNVIGSIPTYDPIINVFPPPDPVTVFGVEFTVTVLMPTSPILVSRISFTASTIMNARILQCSGIVGSMVESESTTLQVVSAGKYSQL